MIKLLKDTKYVWQIRMSESIIPLCHSDMSATNDVLCLQWFSAYSIICVIRKPTSPPQSNLERARCSHTTAQQSPHWFQ